MVVADLYNPLKTTCIYNVGIIHMFRFSNFAFKYRREIGIPPNQTGLIWILERQYPRMKMWISQRIVTPSA